MATPPPVDGTFIEALPTWVQGIITAALGIGTAIGSAMVYIGRKKRPKLDDKTDPDYVITAAAISDTSAFKSMAETLQSIQLELVSSRSVQADILNILQEEALKRLEEQRIQKAVEAALVSQANKIGRRARLNEA